VKVEPFDALSTGELINIAQARGVNLPPATPRNVVIGVINTPLSSRVPSPTGSVASVSRRLAALQTERDQKSDRDNIEAMGGYIVDNALSVCTICLGSERGEVDVHPTG